MTTEGPKAYEEAADFLDSLSAVQELVMDKNMTSIAHDSLTDIQGLSDLNEMDALSLDTYIDNYGIVVGSFAQAVDFGSAKVELVVANLIVDDGDASRANRKNMLNGKFKLFGISTGGHKEFGQATVLIYCQDFYGKNDKKYEEVKPEKKKEKTRVNIVARGSLNKDHRKSIEEIVQAMNLLDKLESKYGVADDDKKVEKKHQDDDELPEGVLKIKKKSEKIVEEGGKKKRIITITKTMEDGSIETEKIKENI